MILEDSSLGEFIHPKLNYIKAEIVWAVKNEMCMSVEDALSRRTRALFLDAQAAIESAPVVASLIAATMNKNESWQKDQVEAFVKVARNYLAIIET